MGKKSKPLKNSDDCGFEFIQECLDGEDNAGINIDRIMIHPTYGIVLMEFLRVNEEQSEFGITPHSSHPNKYWHFGSRKFISQWKILQSFNCKATYFLVTYAKLGEKFDNEVKVMKVEKVNVNKGIKTKSKLMTRKQFKNWIKRINKECFDFDL